jgi:hypothetical protein
MIDQTALSKLIELGGKSPIQSAALLEGVKDYSALNIKLSDEWRVATKSLTNEQLGNLIKGITIAEKAFSWIGGSAASCPVLIKILAERDASMNKVDEISNWVLLNTSNRWSPFGTSLTLGAKTYSEFCKLSKTKNIVYNNKYAEQCFAEDKAVLERKERARFKKQCASIRRSEERTRLLRKLNTMTVYDQLICLSEQKLYTPNFFPTMLAGMSSTEVLLSLPSKNLYAILVQLKGKQKEPWGKFKQRVVNLTEPLYDRKGYYG